MKHTWKGKREQKLKRGSAQIERGPRWLRFSRRFGGINRRASLHLGRSAWRRIFRRGVVVVGFLVVILGLGIGVVDLKRSRLDGDARFTLVVSTPSMVIFSYHPQTLEGVLLQVPDSFMVHAARGYGRWRAVALAGLDTQEGFSGRLLRDTVTQTFGVVVDGQLMETSGKYRNIVDREDLRTLSVSALWRQFTGGVKTNLSLWDLVRLVRILSTTRIDRIKAARLDEVTRLLEVREPDGEVVYTLDDVALGDIARQWFTDENIANEEVIVVVMNDAQTAGLGTRIARVLSIAGVRVVAVENGEGIIGESRVYTSEKFKDSKTLAVITKLIPGILIAPIGDGGRADILLRLGEDVGERFGGGD